MIIIKSKNLSIGFSILTWSLRLWLQRVFVGEIEGGLYFVNLRRRVTSLGHHAEHVPVTLDIPPRLTSEFVVTQEFDRTRGQGVWYNHFPSYVFDKLLHGMESWQLEGVRHNDFPRIFWTSSYRKTLQVYQYISKLLTFEYPCSKQMNWIKMNVLYDNEHVPPSSTVCSVFHH